MNDMVIIDASVLLTAIIGNNKNAEEQLKLFFTTKLVDLQSFATMLRSSRMVSDFLRSNKALAKSAA